jgi:hypothetical protein
LVFPDVTPHQLMRWVDELGLEAPTSYNVDMGNFFVNERLCAGRVRDALREFKIMLARPRSVTARECESMACDAALAGGRGAKRPLKDGKPLPELGL